MISGTNWEKLEMVRIGVRERNGAVILFPLG